MACLNVTPAELHKAKLEYKPAHPHPKIYDYTYGYSMNYYQPMIDYLDARDAAAKANADRPQLPHLPWTNERYIKEYDPKNPIKLYNAEKVDSDAKKYQASAQKNINNFDVKRSYFGSIPTSDATHLVRKLPQHSALEAVYKKDIGQIIRDVENLEMDAYYRYKDGERRMLEEERENFPADLKRALKGKSANQIKYILLNDSARKIRENSEQDAAVTFRQCYATTGARRHARSLSETRPKKCECGGCDTHVCTNVSKTLASVKKELSSFTHNTEDFLHATRYRLELMKEKIERQEKLLKSRKWKENV